jgi:hypothetical protein
MPVTHQAHTRDAIARGTWHLSVGYPDELVVRGKKFIREK